MFTRFYCKYFLGLLNFQTNIQIILIFYRSIDVHFEWSCHVFLSNEYLWIWRFRCSAKISPTSCCKMLGSMRVSITMSHSLQRKKTLATLPQSWYAVLEWFDKKTIERIDITSCTIYIVHTNLMFSAAIIPYPYPYLYEYFKNYFNREK